MAFMLVKVVPGARRTRLVGRYGDAVKAQVAAPPEAGKANQALLKLLAESLEMPLSRFSVAQGSAQPRKRIEIVGVDQPTLDAKLKSMGF